MFFRSSLSAEVPETESSRPGDFLLFFQSENIPFCPRFFGLLSPIFFLFSSSTSNEGRYKLLFIALASLEIFSRFNNPALLISVDLLWYAFNISKNSNHFKRSAFSIQELSFIGLITAVYLRFTFYRIAPNRSFCSSIFLSLVISFRVASFMKLVFEVGCSGDDSSPLSVVLLAAKELSRLACCKLSCRLMLSMLSLVLTLCMDLILWQRFESTSSLSYSSWVLSSSLSICCFMPKLSEIDLSSLVRLLKNISD